MAIKNDVIAFRTRELETFEMVFGKVHGAFTKFKNGESFEGEISLEDMGKINDIAQLSDYLDQVEAEGLAHLTEKIQQCREIMGYFEQASLKTVKSAALFNHATPDALRFFSELKRFISHTLDHEAKPKP